MNSHEKTATKSTDADRLRSKINALETRLRETENNFQKTNEKLISAERKIQYLEDQLKLFRHNQFAKKSESSDSFQLPLLFEPEDDELTAITTPADEAEQETINYTRKKKQSGRNIDTSTLPRAQVIHDLAEDEKQCACCQEALTPMGEDICEKIVFIPAVLKVEEHITKKYSCRRCETAISAKKSESILPKCMADATLLIEVMLAKYHYHLPLYRQAQIFKINGFDIPANTLGNWIMGLAEALMPLFIALKQQFALIKTLQVDETPVKMLNKSSKGYMWCYHSCDPGNRFILYEFNQSRSGNVPNTMLSEFNGILQTDGFSGYNGLRAKDGIIAVGCWAHTRRKFMDAIKIAGKIKKTGKSHQAIATIGKLYGIETQARQQNMTAEQRWTYRQEKAKPIIEKFKIWLEKSINQVPAKSPIATAIGYTLNQWPTLENYLNHGEVEIDNNGVENKIRPLALGRKNWLFLGSQRGADAASVIYSLIQTCLLNDINPRDYFEKILPLLPKVRRSEVDPTNLLPQFIRKFL